MGGAIRCTGGDGALWRLRSLRTLTSCSSWVSIDIKVLTDLGLMITAASIDIKVLSDLWRVLLLRVYNV